MDLDDIPMVRLTWHDAMDAENGWLERSVMEDSSLATCQEVGWLLVDNDEKVVVARSNIVGEEEGGGCIAIPQSWVLKIEVLEPVMELKAYKEQSVVSG